MKKLLVVLIFFIACATAVAADMPDSDRAAIRTAIEGQISAFRHDDGAAAFGYASPRIRGIFKDPDTFMRMVREKYQPVYRPKAMSFRDLETIEGNLVQPVLVVGPTGVPVTALYIMERQEDGSWRIGGCVLVAEPANAI